jgi:DNA-binding NtrC family response regulator
MANILLIDDNAEYLKSTAKVLQDDGHFVQAVQSIDAGIIASNGKTKFLLAIVDLRMESNDDKDISGLNLIRRLPENLPIVLVSLNDKIDPLHEIINFKPRGRIYAYVHKNIHPSVLTLHVRHLDERAKWRKAATISAVLAMVPFGVFLYSLWDRSLVQGVISSILATALLTFSSFMFSRH